MTSLSLDDDQRFALMKFRRAVSDVTKPHHDDYFLKRWLVARNWNTEAAEKMLREYLEWRQFWEVDGLKTWEPPEAIRLYYPSGSTGCDDQGIPVIFVPFGNLDLKGILLSTCNQDMVRNTIKLLEIYLSSNKYYQIVVVFDMSGFSLTDYAWRPAAELVIAMIKMYEANYPEILKQCYIINAPTVFAIAFNVVKRFFNEHTLSKINIYKNDPPKWTKVLQASIPISIIPKCYGGEMVGPDNDPTCSFKIPQGGKVPKSFYQNWDEETTDDEAFKSVVIKKGRKFMLDFIVPEEGCILRWNFRTENHDIRFGITYTDTEGETRPAVKLHRVASNQINEIGMLNCKGPAVYVMEFDNSYSLMRSKKLFYRVGIVNTTPIIEPSDMEKSANVLEKSNES